MEPLTRPTDTIHDRVKLPFSFDVAKMQAEVKALNLPPFVYYDSLPLRSPAFMVDSSIPVPPPAEDFADGSWTDWLDTTALQACPYLQEVLQHFREHCTVNLVRILRLAPGAVVKEHTDPTLGLQIEKSMIRLTIPIQVGEAVTFFLNDEAVPMKMGECWYLRLTDPHRVVNDSPDERINMTIDIVPNAWIKSIILAEDQRA